MIQKSAAQGKIWVKNDCITGSFFCIFCRFAFWAPGPGSVPAPGTPMGGGSRFLAIPNFPTSELSPASPSNALLLSFGGVPFQSDQGNSGFGGFVFFLCVFFSCRSWLFPGGFLFCLIPADYRLTLYFFCGLILFTSHKGKGWMGTVSQPLSHPLQSFSHWPTPPPEGVTGFFIWFLARTLGGLGKKPLK